MDAVEFLLGEEFDHPAGFFAREEVAGDVEHHAAPAESGFVFNVDAGDRPRDAVDRFRGKNFGGEELADCLNAAQERLRVATGKANDIRVDDEGIFFADETSGVFLGEAGFGQDNVAGTGGIVDYGAGESRGDGKIVGEEGSGLFGASGFRNEAGCGEQEERLSVFLNLRGAGNEGGGFHDRFRFCCRGPWNAKVSQSHQLYRNEWSFSRVQFFEGNRPEWC